MVAANMSGFSLSALKNTLDEVRVQVYPKNETEKKVAIEILCLCLLLYLIVLAQVYEALSSKNYGASSTQMSDIAADTFD